MKTALELSRNVGHRVGSASGPHGDERSDSVVDEVEFLAALDDEVVIAGLPAKFFVEVLLADHDGGGRVGGALDLDRDDRGGLGAVGVQEHGPGTSVGAQKQGGAQGGREHRRRAGLGRLEGDLEVGVGFVARPVREERGDRGA